MDEFGNIRSFPVNMVERIIRLGITQSNAGNYSSILRNHGDFLYGCGVSYGGGHNTSAEPFVMSQQTNALGNKSDVQHGIFDENITGNAG